MGMVPNSLAFCRCFFFLALFRTSDLLCLLAHCLVCKKVSVEHWLHYCDAGEGGVLWVFLGRGVLLGL